MNTIQLTKDMIRNKRTKKYFRGVFPCDKLPKRFKRPALIIANTDASTESGRHWVAFYIPIKGPSEYFDSVGRKPVNEEFIKFLKRCGKSYVYNLKRLQGVFSNVCGNYCSMYLLYRAKNQSRSKFINLFTENYANNDEKIIKLYKRNFQREQFGANSVSFNQTSYPQS